MKKITFLFLTFLLSFVSWQTWAQSTIHITTSGGSYATEKWVSITTETNGAGTQVWGQGNGTYGNGAGLINLDISIAPGTYYVNCYDKYADGWDGTLISVTAYASTLTNNGGVSPDGNGDLDASSSWGDTQAQELEVSLQIVVPSPPSCLAPTALSNSNITSNSADFNWTESGTATSWTVEIKTGADFVPGTNANDWIQTVSNHPVNFAVFQPNTTYYWYVKANCGSESSTWAGPYSFYTGYCIPVATLNGSYIDGVTTTGALNNISNLATGFTSGGYANYFDTVAVETYAGGQFDFEFSIVGGTVGAAIWVDWNHDLIFEVTEVVYTTTAFGNGPFTGTAVIPNAVPNGNYRIRVMIDYNDSNPGDDGACGFTSGRGEVEDYKLTISDAPTDTPDWYNMQWLSDGTNGSNTSLTVNAWSTVTGYAQAWEPGVTDAAGQGAGLECWIGGNPSNTNPATWPEDSWNVATYLGDSGNNDEYSINKVMDFSGTVYVASRWRLNGAPYVYGGYNNPWNGTSANSIELISNPVLANDNCAGAVSLTVNTDLTCTAITSGTTVNATESQADDNAPCAGNNDDDVWYSFVATASTHVVTLSNVVAVTGTSTDMYFQVLSGTCGSLTSVLCSDPNSASLSGLTIGGTYYVRVYSYASTSRQTFDICIGTLPPPPVNDNCDGAYTLTVNSDYACGAVTSGTLASATPSGVSESACFGTENDDVWFSFVATSTTHRISLLNITPSTDMYHSLWTGGCSGLTLVSGSCSDADTSNPSGLVVGTTYYVRVNSYGSTSGLLTTFNVCIGTPPPPPANDECSTAINVTTLPYSNTQDASGATNNAGFILACSTGTYGGMNDGVWYSFTVETAGSFTVALSGVGAWDPQLDVYSGSCGTFSCISNQDVGISGGAETATFAGEAGVTYYVNVGYWSNTTNNSEGPFTVTISGDGTLGTPITNIDGFKLYPNPTNSVLNINALNTIDSVVIYSMLGQKVMSQSTDNNQVQLDLSNLPTGSYIVRVQAGNQVGSYNLIKN